MAVYDAGTIHTAAAHDNPKVKENAFQILEIGKDDKPFVAETLLAHNDGLINVLSK